MTGAMTNAIEVRGLRKSFGRTTALDGLDLSVRSGEVHAFLGPNGAGKTTTIRILLGLLSKDGGEASLLGGDPWRDAVALHARLAYVPGDVTLWPGLTGGEIIDLLASLRGPRSAVDPKRRQALIERFALDPAKKARAYSKGNRQKVALIAALASDAELLILDEPTAGLDPLMEAVFRECVDDERQRGRTVLLSSHILAEAEALADRVTIIRDGRTAETGTLAQMRHLTRSTVDAELSQPVSLDGLPGVHAADIRGTHLHCEVDHAALNEVLTRLTAAGVFLYGRLSGDSLGAVSAWRYGVWAAIFASLMSVFLVIRHTRADEEAGRLELVGSAAVGRLAALTAALLVAVAATVALTVLLVAALVFLGLPAAGSAAFALAITTCSLAFAALAALAAQLAAGARPARGIAIGVLGAAYLLRAVGDASGAGGPSWLTWLSPLGWTEFIRPYSENRWQLLALPLATAAAAMAGAYALAVL